MAHIVTDDRSAEKHPFPTPCTPLSSLSSEVTKGLMDIMTDDWFRSWRRSHSPPHLLLSLVAEGLTDIVMDDWSEEVAPFWGAVIRSALTGQGWAGLMRAGWTTIKV